MVKYPQTPNEIAALLEADNQPPAEYSDFESLIDDILVEIAKYYTPLDYIKIIYVGNQSGVYIADALMDICRHYYDRSLECRPMRVFSAFGAATQLGLLTKFMKVGTGPDSLYDLVTNALLEKKDASGMELMYILGQKSDPSGLSDEDKFENDDEGYTFVIKRAIP